MASLAPGYSGRHKPPRIDCIPSEKDTGGSLVANARLRQACSCSTNGTLSPPETLQWQSRAAKQELPYNSKSRDQKRASRYNIKHEEIHLLPGTAGTSWGHTCLASPGRWLCMSSFAAAILGNTHCHQISHVPYTECLRNRKRGTPPVPRTPPHPCTSHRRTLAGRHTAGRGVETLRNHHDGSSLCLVVASRPREADTLPPAMHNVITTEVESEAASVV